MNKKKRVLCLIDSLGPGGAQRQIVGLAVFLMEQGYNVNVAFYHDNFFYANKLMSKGVSYSFLNKAKSSTLRMYYIAQYIRRVRPDVVISYLEVPSICACFAHFFFKKWLLIVSERNTTQRTGHSERLRFNMFRLADYIVPNAFSQEEYIKEMFPALSKKVVTIPNFVDLQQFSPINRKRHVVPEIIIVATIWESKNTMGFIDVVSLLNKKGLRFHISWYGKETTHLDYFNNCQQKIEQLGLSEYIELKEKSTIINKKYQTADYFCLPSFYEGTPNALCEAMASGLPILCSDVCDNRRYVEEGKNGFLFNPREADDIVHAICKMLSLSDEDYRHFCNTSRERAEKMFSREQFVQSYMKLIEK